MAVAARSRSTAGYERRAVSPGRDIWRPGLAGDLTGAATVLVTVRMGEPAPDAVVALWKDGPAERVEVGALRDAAVEELLTAALRGPVDAAAVHQLAGYSRRNPLVLRELVCGAPEGGVLAAEGGTRRELTNRRRVPWGCWVL